MDIFTEGENLPAQERIDYILQIVQNYSYNDWYEFTSRFTAENGYMLANDIFHMKSEDKEIQIRGATKHLEKGSDFGLLFIILSKVSKHQLAMARKCWLEQIEISPSEPHTREELIKRAHNLAKKIAGAFLQNQIPDDNFHFYSLISTQKEKLLKKSPEELVQFLFKQLLDINLGDGDYTLSSKKFRNIELRVLGEI